MKAAELNYFRSLSFAPMESSKKEETCKRIYDQALSPVFAGWFPKNFPLHGHILIYINIHMNTDTHHLLGLVMLLKYTLFFLVKSARDRYM